MSEVRRENVKHKGQVRRFGVRSRVLDQGSELRSEIKGFRSKDWRVGIIG